MGGYELRSLCSSAFSAEYHHDQRAQSLHTSSIEDLKGVIRNAGFFDGETKRVAKLRIGIHQERLKRLDAGLPFILTVVEDVKEGIDNVICSGKSRIGIDEMILHNRSHELIRNQSPAIDPYIHSLLQNPAPFYTPTLDPSLPTVTYSIHANMDQNPLKSTHWCYVKIKDSTKAETLYICEALKHRRTQFPQVKFCRASEYPEPRYITDITPVTHKALPQILGRPLRHASVYGGAVDERPDRDSACDLWQPRRFTFGGRRFVWKANPAWKKSGSEVLYEVRSEWGVPGSKTGKMEDEVFDRKLAWTTSDRVIGHTRIEVVGGMDKLFREFLFASQCVKAMIYRYGHIGEE